MTPLEDIIRAIVRDEVARAIPASDDRPQPVARVPANWSVDIYGVLPDKPAKGGYVYFLLHSSPEPHIKIGYAKDLSGRLSNAQTGTPHRLRYVAYFWAEQPEIIESDLHERFTADCVRGEWHRLTADLTDTINLVRSEMRAALDRAMGRISGGS